MEKIKQKGGKSLIGVEDNLVDVVWGKDKPARPNEKVKVLSQEFAGKTFQEKIEDTRKELEKKKSAGLVVCMSEQFPREVTLESASSFLADTLTKLCWMRWLGCSIYVATSMFR